MSQFSNKIDESGYGNYGAGGGGYGSYGGFGGVGLLFAVIILWFLFKDGHRDERRGYGCEGGYMPMGRPHYPDESNYEQERNLDNKMCGIDKAVHAEGEATRGLIQSNYIQDLRDKCAASDAKVLQLENRVYSDHKYGEVMAAIGKTNCHIDKLECELPKRPPVWADVRLPAEKVCYNEPQPVRRGRCGFDDRFGFGDAV